MYRALCVLIVCFATITHPTFADTRIIVNFSKFELTVLEGDRTVLHTSVVLPRGDYYPVPISGTVTRAELGPTWVPTPNMHRDYPGRYRTRYGPYQSGNAMGHCKLTIDFAGDIENQHPILRTVRVHGNAQQKDLGTKVSRSCVRIPDTLCPSLVEAVHDAEGQVQILFVLDGPST